MSYLLFLDDVRKVKDIYTEEKLYNDSRWVIVKNYDEFVEYITKHGLPLHVSFDHDLGPEHYHPSMLISKEEYDEVSKTFKEKTGLDCAKWLCNYCMDNKLKFPEYNVHSYNPVGAENIRKYIENYIAKVETQQLLNPSNHKY